MSNPVKDFTKKEWSLWLGSLLIVVVSNLFSGDVDLPTLVAALVGVTSLIFAAKGNVWAQILMVVFSILYGIISWRFRYWGEMMTYLGMTLPMAVWSTITWLKNPSETNGSEVAIQQLNCYFLWVLKTPNLLFSTISITTSFVAAALTMLRSSYYAVGYAANDLVLIVLWSLAAMENPAYIPVIVNFVIFFFNDMYGFISWRRREAVQG